MFMAKLDCSGVCFQRLLSTTSGLASRFSLMTETGLVAGGLVVDVGDAVKLPGG